MNKMYHDVLSRYLIFEILRLGGRSFLNIWGFDVLPFSSKVTIPFEFRWSPIELKKFFMKIPT